MAMTRNPIDLVREFHVAFGRPVRDLPDPGSPEERVLRVRLMLEEVLEFAKAAGVLVAFDGEIIPTVNHLGFSAEWFNPDLTAMAHELADIQYVVSGTAVQLGIPIDSCVAEIHAANMRKLGPDGKPTIDEHGKVRKPDGWKPADVAGVLARHPSHCECAPCSEKRKAAALQWIEALGSRSNPTMEQTAECESCPDRADFEILCCKGGAGATVTDPEGLLDNEICPKREDKIHCEHWQDGKACCDCGAPADPDVCELCGAADGHGPDCDRRPQNLP